MKHQTSIRVSKRLYFYFRELQLSQKITISKTVLYISENYNQLHCSLHIRKLQSAKLFSTSHKITISKQLFKEKNHKKEKREAGKREKLGGEV